MQLTFGGSPTTSQFSAERTTGARLYESALLTVIDAMAPSVNALHANFDVDYVIVYRFHDTGKYLDAFRELRLTICLPTDKAEASTDFKKLVQALARVGLAIEVRNGENLALLVLVKVASDERLSNAVYRSR